MGIAALGFGNIFWTFCVKRSLFKKCSIKYRDTTDNRSSKLIDKPLIKKEITVEEKYFCVKIKREWRICPSAIIFKPLLPFNELRYVDIAILM